jgi:hypothetical protein
MNKFKKILVGILGGIDVVVTIITPIILSLFWVKLFGISFATYVLIIACGLAALFRAIKIDWIRR